MKSVVRILGALVLVNLAFVPAGSGADSDEDKEQGIKKYGVVFDMAEDRKINKVGGIYEPEQLDKYMKRRFDSADTQLAALSGKIDALQSGLEEMQKTLERLAAKKDGSTEAEGSSNTPRTSGKAQLVR